MEHAQWGLAVSGWLPYGISFIGHYRLVAETTISSGHNTY